MENVAIFMEIDNNCLRMGIVAILAIKELRYMRYIPSENMPKGELKG